MALLPLRYSVRNLARRRTRTVLTILGLALAMGTVVFMLAFSRSFAAAVRQTGDADNLIIVSKKAQTHVLSSMPARECDLIRSKLRDDAATAGEEPLISREVYIGLNVELPGAHAVREGHKRAVLHGVEPQLALDVNRLVSLKEGTMPRVGKRELLCGETAAVRIGVPAEALRVGSILRFLDTEWTVVGRFAAPGTLMESEIWTHVEDLRLHLKRRDYSFMRVKLKDPGKMTAVIDRLSTDEQFSVKAFAEQTYFADYAAGFIYFRYFAQVLALLIVGGGVIAGMNTMYTAIMGRVREIGTLQVIGFSKRSVLVGLLTESVVISLAGGVLGCLVGFAVNGLPVKIPMGAFRMRVDLPVILWTVSIALGVGLFGAVVPAYRALKLRMVDAVRYE